MLYRPSDAVSATKLEYVIPRGVPVGMTSVLVHHNPKLFPRSTEFDPKRWLDSEGKRDRSLEKYILSFSKGSRQCVGIKYAGAYFNQLKRSFETNFCHSLAYAELFMVVGLILRRLGPRLRLYETGLDDVEILHDLFVPIPKLDTKGIRVRII